MPLQIQGNGGITAEVDSNSRAIRITPRPIDVGALGSYRVAEFSGLMTGIAAKTATAGHVFSWRWGDATRVAALRYVKIRYAVITGFTAAQELGFDAIIARTYSASHTGGTALTLTTNSMKKRTSMATTLLTDARIATTAALTAGTHTLDAQPFMMSEAKTLAAAATVQDSAFEETLDMTDGYDYPYLFAQNEGFVVRNSIAMGAAGTVRMHVAMAWDELTAF
jgi:hypothetical protein